VASVHVLVSRDEDYMEVTSGIRKALHEHGVHSSTIQPEFGDEAEDMSVSSWTYCHVSRAVY
jgi:solute carrier family 30 (zinc transporter), member 1